MAISMNCPNCLALFELDEDLAGKKVKCQKCEAVFSVPMRKEPEPEEAKVEEDEKIVPKLELDEPAATPPAGTEVSSATRPNASKRSTKDGDEDEDEDRSEKPRPKGPPARKRSESSRGPRRDAAEKSGSGSGPWVIVLLLLGVGLLSCVGCAGVGAVWFVIGRAEHGDFDGPPPRPGPIVNVDKRDGLVRDGFKDKGPGPAQGQVVNVNLDANGVFTANHRIELTDPLAPISPFNNKRHRVYLTQLEAGQTYQIDMSADFDFDAYLYVLENNNILAQDDDGGGAHNARIVFRPTRTGPYRIIATSLGGNAIGPFTLTIRRNDPTKDPAKNPPLVALNDLSYRVYTYMFNETPVADAVWSRDGNFFYILGRSGLLQRVNTATGKTEKVSQLQGLFNERASLQISQVGLVVSTPVDNKVRVHDATDPAVVKRVMTVGSVDRLTSGADATFAVAQLFQFGRSSLVVLDLERGLVGNPIPAKTSLYWSTMSPDGKYVFATEAGKLHRYRIDGLSLTLEETSQQIVQFGDGIHVSPDSKFVCLTGAPSFVNLIDHPVRGTHVYPVGNLQKPALTMTAMQPRYLGIDAKNGWFIGSDNTRALVLCNNTGALISQPSIPGIFSFNTRGVTVSPSRGEALLRAGDRVAYLRLNNKNGPIAHVDPGGKKEDRSLVGTTTRTGDFVFKNLSMRPIVGFGLYGADPCWDSQGKYLYHTENGITLMKINPDFKIELSIQLAQTCRHQALSAEGMVLIPSNATEIWLHDAQTLARKKTISLTQNPIRVTSSPGSSLAFALTSELMTIDLKAGTAVKTQFEGKPAGIPGIKAMALSPDGKYLFLQASDYWLHRARIEGNRVIHESAKEPVIRSNVTFAISPDSKQMAVCHLTALKAAANKVQQTNVYAIDNWGVPAYTLQSRIRTIAFASGGAIYADQLKNGIRFYRNPATMEFNFNSWTPQSLGRRLIARPGSNGCLVLQSSDLTQWVEPIAKN